MAIAGALSAIPIPKILVFCDEPQDFALAR
jgi:hypothetical protein